MPSAGVLAQRWWVPIVRGVVAILFGLALLVVPKLGLLTLAILWGAYAFVDGVLSIVHAARGARAGRRWGWLLFEGIVSVLAGIIAFLWPGITVLAFLIVIAVRALIGGVAEIVAAITLRRQISGEWFLALTGVLSIVFGVLLLVYPLPGILALAWLIAIYALLFGVLLISLGLRLHGYRESARPFIPTTSAPSGP
ncbi:MAG TPA: HdeD family acid-resistance protein [Polyangiaceae bacterium]|nr:HdeD family acid-resistance protein [Polyangiaceae bacterium]